MLIPRARMGSPLEGGIVPGGSLSWMFLSTTWRRSQWAGKRFRSFPGSITLPLKAVPASVAFRELADEKRRLLETGPCPVCIGKATASLKRLWDPAHEDRQGLYGRRPFIQQFLRTGTMEALVYKDKKMLRRVYTGTCAAPGSPGSRLLPGLWHMAGNGGL